MTASRGPALLATSDLHLGHPANRGVAEGIRPGSADDWLIVAGDIGEQLSDIEWGLALLKERFDTVLWAPGNHELWSRSQDPTVPRGAQRYFHIVALCRRLGVLTPEDDLVVWNGPGGPAIVAPLFLLYDYTFRAAGATTKQESLARANAAGVVCADEAYLDPVPYPSREAWCRARVAETRRRLERRDRDLPIVLVNHFPLLREPTRALRHPEFAQWCGTTSTADWHRRFKAICVVYGHLHIPRRTWHDGVRFEEVSLGYPREWMRRAGRPTATRRILPPPKTA